MKKLIKKWLGIVDQPEPITEKDSLFSTHFEKPNRNTAQRVLREKSLAVIKSLPQADVSGSGMDDFSDLKQFAGGMQPNIPDALALWFASQSFIGYQLCAFIAQHWLVDKCCTMPARDAIRHGFEIVSEEEDKLDVKVIKEIERCNKVMKLNKHLEEFIRRGRIFGIRILFFKIDSDDDQFYEKPFNIDGVKEGSYKGIVQVDPFWIVPVLSTSAAIDPSSMEFYEPEWWQINGKKYHRSHLMIFRNAEVTDLLKPSYLYGGMSIPQLIMERVYAAERTANEGPLLAMTKRTTVFQTNIAQAYANKEKFDLRMAEWQAMRDNQQIKIADKEADLLTQFDTSLTDLDVIIMTQYQLVAAASKVPATKLLGTSPKGFNATGEYEEASYHEELESIQTHECTPVIDRHHQLVIKSRVEPLFGKIPEIGIEWNPTDSPTAAETAEINNKKSQTAKNWSDVGSIDGYDGRDFLISDKDSGYSFLEAAERPDDFEPPEEPDPNAKPDNFGNGSQDAGEDYSLVNEIIKGFKEEQEHKNSLNGNEIEILEIVFDHLKKNPNYYSELLGAGL